MAAAAPIDGEDTAAAAGDWNLPRGALLEIRRAPPPEEPMALAFVVNYSDHTPKKLCASAYAIDGDLAEGRCREVWRSKLVPPKSRFIYYARPPYYNYYDASKPEMVGTCTELLCLCENIKPGGAIALVNPATGERLVVPPLPGSAHWVSCWGTGMRVGWSEAYSFTYHQETGLYKIVHVPCYFDKSGAFSEMQVFTLGEPSWRDVPVPGASCRIDAGVVSIDAGVVSIDGVVYWVTKGTERVVSFDLMEERVMSTTALPVRHERSYAWRLAVVHGRLGDVWVLGAGRDQQGWSRRYSVQIGVRELQLAWPHFVHGDHVLTVETSNKNSHLFAHRMPVALGGEVRSSHITERGQLVPGMSCSSIRGVFAYVRTEEPLSVYNPKAS